MPGSNTCAVGTVPIAHSENPIRVVAYYAFIFEGRICGFGYGIYVMFHVVRPGVLGILCWSWKHTHQDILPLFRKSVGFDV